MSAVLSIRGNLKCTWYISVHCCKHSAFRFRELHEVAVCSLLRALHPRRHVREIVIVGEKSKFQTIRRLDPKQEGTRLGNGEIILRRL